MREYTPTLLEDANGSIVGDIMYMSLTSPVDLLVVKSNGEFIPIVDGAYLPPTKRLSTALSIVQQFLGGAVGPHAEEYDRITRYLVFTYNYVGDADKAYQAYHLWCRKTYHYW